jgi:hypothetical protein
VDLTEATAEAAGAALSVLGLPRAVGQLQGEREGSGAEEGPQELGGGGRIAELMDLLEGASDVSDVSVDSFGEPRDAATAAERQRLEKVRGSCGLGHWSATDAARRWW